MYLPTHFGETRPEALQQLLRTHPLGLLTTLGPHGLEANALPFLLDPEPAPLGTLVGHVARANPVWRETRTDVEALVVFQGPQAYVSPGWYPSKAETGKVVPTWNYVMVQARGRLRVIDDVHAARALVTRLTERHEAAQARPWGVSDAPADYIDAMLRAIICIEIPLSSLIGKYKLSQNRPAADREGVVQALRDSGDAAQQQTAQWMEAAS
jgi:transcriptional regulator